MKAINFSASVLCKQIFIGFFFSTGILSLILAVLALIGIVPLTFNGISYTGFSGFLIGLLYIPLISVAATFSTVPFIVSGLWIAGRLWGLKKNKVSHPNSD